MCPDGNWTGDPLVHKLVLNPLSHTSWAINVFWWTEVLQFTEVLFFNFFLFYGESLIVSYLINLYLFQGNEDILLFSYRICIVLTFTFISTIHLQLRSIRYRSKLLLDTYPIDPALFIEGGGVPCPHFCGILWFCVKKKKKKGKPWLVWLSGLSDGLQTKASWVWFPVRVHTRVVGQVPRGAQERQPHMGALLPLFSLPSTFSKNK